MNPEDRNIWTSLGSSLLVNSYFLHRIWTMFHDGTADLPNGLQIWAQTVLWVVPAAIVSTIVLTILVGIAHGMITGERNATFLKDERDQKFQLWGLGGTLIVMILGFPLCLATLALGGTAFVAFNLVYLTMFLADIAGNLLKLGLYRAGS
jgi:putative flippase GtrA